MKNYRLRNDGYYEWRKVIDKHRYSLKSKNFKDLQRKVSDFKNSLTIKAPTLSYDKKDFYSLALEWYNLFKKDKISSAEVYMIYIKNDFNIGLFSKNIKLITLEELQRFINRIDKHRKAKYCYLIIKNVFRYALQKDLIKKDISQFLQSPKNKTEKGTAFTLAEQKLILDNINKTPIGLEILFFLLTGCRRSEAYNTEINFEKNIIFVNGSKTKSAKRYIPLSDKFKNILLKNQDSIFSHSNEDYYTKEFKKFLESINIKNKTLHDLRHTFATNLYYLGIPDKQRQYYMGHSSIVITNDIYTTLDPTITKEDIIKLYNNLYPEFK